MTSLDPFPTSGVYPTKVCSICFKQLLIVIIVTKISCFLKCFPVYQHRNVICMLWVVSAVCDVMANCFCPPSVFLWKFCSRSCRLRGNIIRTALCWIVRHNVHSQQHTYMSCSYRSNRLGLSHWDPYAVHRGGCLEFYYCNMVEWYWWDSSLISTTACKNCPEMTYDVLNEMSSNELTINNWICYISWRWWM